MASAGANYIGCQISLISKSDIRYEGTLYEMNQNDLTVSLADVRALGTEDRRPAAPVAPRDEVYQYIVFRSADIKDLIVREAPRRPESQLEDPAILEVKAASNAGQHGMLGQHGGNAFPPQRAAQMAFPVSSSQMPNTGAALQNSARMDPSGFTGMAQTPQYSSSSASHQPTTSAETLNHGRNMPMDHNLLSRGSVKDLPYVDPFAVNPQQYLEMNQQRRQESTTTTYNGAGQGSVGDYHSGESRSFERGGLRGARGGVLAGTRGGVGSRGRGFAPQYNAGGQQGQYNAGGMGYGRGGGYGPQSRDRPNTGQLSNIRNDYQSVQITNSGQLLPTPQQTGANASPRQKLPEFDFESAKSAFQEIEEKMKNVQVSGSPGGGGSNNTAHDNGGEASGQDENADVPREKFYDPNSFYDNISCDALEKEKGPNRTDWRKEGRLNSETFGAIGNTSRVYENQSNRGRGGYYRGYGSRGGYSGGGRGGYGGYNRGYQGDGGYGYSGNQSRGFYNSRGSRELGSSRGYASRGGNGEGSSGSQPRAEQSPL